MRRVLFGLLVVAIATAGCSSSEPGPTPAPQPAPTLASSPIPTAPPVVTPASTHTATATRALAFTATPAATSRPTPTATPTPTPVPVPMVVARTPSPQPLRRMEVRRAFPNLTFRQLTNLVQPDDGRDRIFVTEQPGRIRVFPNDQEALSAETFLDIRDRVSERHNEEGLLGLAFDPDFNDSGYFFVYYSAADPRRSVISRFSVSQSNPNVADPESEFVILEIAEPFGNHNGGQIAFGPDGFLYIGVGDGGSGADPLGNGQNKGTLLGTILRIDVGGVSSGMSYRIPPDNPFVNVAGARQEIWAYGLRNPWRFSFDIATGLLWVADVGQNRWEEIDIVEQGLNYGWNVMEGRHCFSPSSGCDTAGLETPVTEYDHAEGCSVTGGYVYRGSLTPVLLGMYVYGDFCSGNVWGLRYDGQSVTEEMLLVRSDLLITSFGQDVAANLYILDRAGGIYYLAPEE